MFDRDPNNIFGESPSAWATAHHPEGTGGALFACEPLEGSGFESEVPEDEFERGEPQWTSAPPTSKRDLRQEITDQIIRALEQGTAPWQKPCCNLS